MELSAGYQLTELGLIRNDWKISQVQDVCRLVNGRGFKPFEWSTQGLPIIRIQNLNGSGDFNFYNGDYDKKIEILTGQLLFAWSGSRGTSFGPHFWSGTKGVLNYHTWKVVVDEQAVDSKFFFYALKKLTEFIEERAHGASALVHTQKWEMETFKFPMPSDLNEQRAIAKSLSDVDALIAGLEKLIAKKRDLKQAAMQQLLTGQTRLPGFSGEWAIKPLGVVAQIQKGQLITTETIVSGDVPVIAGGKKPAYFHNKPNRIGKTITVSASGASAGYVAFHRSPIFASDCSTISEAKTYCIEFVFFAMQLKQEEIYNAQTGGAQPHIQPKDLAPLMVPFPTNLREQEAIASVLCDMDDELISLESRLVKTRELKQGMMQELLTGKTRLI